ncbi:MAG: protein-L-isoaspartate(D-aspartate) O-methyltransferase [Planctomycetaceae bacterium]|jgi:protein-L-isoaspartate(D-aspartate) O-methyltransferase|nr:protein-L-isoaspartate(D-aspartate) O-methyltransferase [Planctomycetaceae bacterium]
MRIIAGMMRTNFYYAFAAVSGIAVLGMLFTCAGAAQGPKEDMLKKFPVIEPAKELVEHVLLPQGGLTNARVLDAMQRIPRHLFVPPLHRVAAYWDQALPIGHKQTISPPYVVAYMTEQLDPKPTDNVLEIGTGSGYQAAVLSLLVNQVCTVEIVEELGKKAEKLLKEIGAANVQVKIGDGFQGWKERAPFDKIILTCSPETVPQPLIDQLKEGGRMIVPLGSRHQQRYYLYKKKEGKLVQERLLPTLFVPMTGEAEKHRTAKADEHKTVLINGDFSETEKDGTPGNWHYARNVQVIKGKDGEPNYVRFQRKHPAKINSPQKIQLSQIIQGLAIDGRETKMLTVKTEIRGDKITAVQGSVMPPTAFLSFYDEDLQQITAVPMNSCLGTFGWRKVKEEIPVPPAAREAVLMLGLAAAAGQLDVRNVELKAAPAGGKEMPAAGKTE